MADVPVPVGAHDIYNEETFFDQLAKLVAENLYIDNWIFKIDDEYGGRGHAYLDVTSIKSVMELRKLQIALTAAIQAKLKAVLKKTVPKKAQIAMKSLYRSWNMYIERYCHVGGVIEAAPICPLAEVSSPSISFFIEPDGEIELVGTFDRIQAIPFVNAGCFFP